jgi:uncharacterized damage-inducible protein DinB
MDLRYPIGKHEPQPFSDTQKLEWLQDLQSLPDILEAAVENLDEEQLNTHYRDGGWTVKQVVHHLADSHTNAYVRFKLGLTETNPTIKPYDEKLWAELADVKQIPITTSIALLNALHSRWHSAVHLLPQEEWHQTVTHPEHKDGMSLWHLLGVYSWHGRHHVAHITSLRERKGW